MQANSKRELTIDLKNNGLIWVYLKNQIYLSYKFKVASENIALSGNYFIDAIQNSLLYFEPSICTNKESKIPPNALGSAQTLYSGNRSFTTDANFNGGFRLRQVRNSVNIWTLNANNQSNIEVIANNATDFFDNDNIWQAAEHGIDRYATDVHWATENVVDYWRIQHNRNSINGFGMNVVGYVHTSMPWANNVNAFWDRDLNSMFYADGNPSLGFGPIAAFDVVAHEFGHGICQYTSALVAGTAESGALNEGFSDIWGAAIETWAAPTKNRWLIGEDIFPVCLRNMLNPKDASASEGQHPNTYLRQFWRNDGEPHNNSTILSHWFYLISDGGNGTNDLGNVFNVNGLGINTAARIAYATERFLPSNAGYFQARATSIQMVRDTFGIGSCEEIAVTKAWYAVGVGADFVINTIISGPDRLCSNSTVTYTINSVLCNASVTWSTTGSSLVTISPSNGSNITLIPNGFSGTINLIATITNAGVVTQLSKQILIGAPVGVGLVSFNNMNYCVTSDPFQPTTFAVLAGGGDYYPYSATIQCGATNATTSGWSFVASSGGIPWSYTNVINGVCIISAKRIIPGSYLILRFTASNACGNISKNFIFTSDCYLTRQSSLSENSTTISPNPTTGIINILLDSKDKLTNIKEIRIKNKMGVLVFNKKYNNNQITQSVNIANQMADLYIVEIFDGKDWSSQKLSLIK